MRNYSPNARGSDIGARHAQLGLLLFRKRSRTEPPIDIRLMQVLMTVLMTMMHVMEHVYRRGSGALFDFSTLRRELGLAPNPD